MSDPVILAVDAAQGLPRWLTLLLATACGLIVANIYYAQPLVGPIAAAIGLPPGSAGLIVTMSQLGYGAGLLLVVPLGDLLETRRLVLASLSLAVLALLVAALSTAATPFLLASLFIGLGSVAVQVLVPYAAHLAPEASRGRVVGNVMSGLMLGIMLSRPVSSVLDDLLGWHAVFAISAAVMVVLGLVLRLALPRLQPPPGLSYPALLASMAALVRHTPLLRRRATYHAFLFGAFSVFWTTVPLLLARSFHLSQTGIAVFAAVGVGGAVSAPLAGHAADRGWLRSGTVLAMAGVALAFVAMLTERRLEPHAALVLLGACAVLLDFAVTAHLVFSQRALFALGPATRSRLNGLFMATFFCGGAAGSAAGAWAFAHGGWTSSCRLGLALPILALCCVLTERRDRAAAATSPAGSRSG